MAKPQFAGDRKATRKKDLEIRCHEPGLWPRPAAVSVNINLVEPVDTFVYLGSLQSSGGYCWPDMKRRMGLAASAMSSLHRIWNDKCLSIPMKIRLFQALILSILLYASKTWTLRVTDMKTLEAFYLKCLWHILGVRWHQHITNSEILSYAGVGPLAEQIARRRSCFWPHRTTGWQCSSSSGPLLSDRRISRRLPSNTWKRRPGRPRKRRLDIFRQDS